VDGSAQGRLSKLRYQVVVTAIIFFGLFFIEYPPLFELGYWAWPYTVGYTAHKIISGIFIILNLGITQYLVRRWGFFHREDKASPATMDHPASEPGHLGKD
jgi:hypothetical protein